MSTTLGGEIACGVVGAVSTLGCGITGDANEAACLEELAAAFVNSTHAFLRLTIYCH
jgi:hypothetical protein